MKHGLIETFACPTMNGIRCFYGDHMESDDKIEAKHTSENRLQTALRTGISYAGIGAVFGYVAHLFDGKPGTNPANYVSKDAFQRTATNAAFFGVVGTAIAAIWPGKFGRTSRNAEVTVKLDPAGTPAPPPVADHKMAQSPPAQIGQDHAPTSKSHTAAETARRETPAQENQHSL